MRFILLSILVAALAGCGGRSADVKKRWTENLLAYSFVPMYPARGDVEVGDIRVHRATGGSAAFDSRLLWDWDVNRVVSIQPKDTAAILPGIEVVRLFAMDLSSIGLKGLLTRMFGTKFEATETVHVVLKDIRTAEVSDVKVAKGFLLNVASRLQVNPRALENPFKINELSDDVIGFCAAAITLDYKQLKEIRISIVTRTVSIGGITYVSGSGFATVDGKSSPNATASQPGSLDGQPGIAATTTNAINEKNGIPDGQRVVIGVDALTVKPTEIVPDLKQACKMVAKYYDAARLKEFFN